MLFTAQEADSHCGGMCEIHLSWNSRWRQPPYWISKDVNIYGLDEQISTTIGGQMHHGHVEMTAWTEIETWS